ncbi:MAG: PAS domain-containing protein [Alphaproteobacteria bacterium]
MVRRLWFYWERIRLGRPLPAMRDVDPQRLPVDWSECFVVPIAEGGGEPRFEYVGDSLIVDCGQDPTNRPVSSVPADTLLGRSTGCLAEAVTRRAPVIVEGRFRHTAGDDVLLRGIVLPFSRDRKTIDYLLGATSCRRLTGA